MIRSIALSLIFISLCQASFLSIDFNPNTAENIPNPLGSTITLRCTIKTPDVSDVMVGNVVSGKTHSFINLSMFFL